MPYVCGMCDEEPGSLLITPLSGADTMVLGANCVAVGLAGLLAGFVGLDPDKLYDTIGAMLAEASAPPSTEATGTASKPPAARRTRSKGTPAPQVPNQREASE